MWYWILLNLKKYLRIHEFYWILNVQVLNSQSTSCVHSKCFQTSATCREMDVAMHVPPHVVATLFSGTFHTSNTQHYMKHYINGSPYSITERRVLEIIPVLCSQPANDVSHAVGCLYFPPGPQLPSQPLRGLLQLLGEQRHNGCEQFA